jgi:hypothetical protein
MVVVVVAVMMLASLASITRWCYRVARVVTRGVCSDIDFFKTRIVHNQRKTSCHLIYPPPSISHVPNLGWSVPIAHVESPWLPKSGRTQEPYTQFSSSFSLQLKRERRRELSVGAAFTNDFLPGMDFPHVLSEQTSPSMTLRFTEAQAYADNLITRLTENTDGTTEAGTTTTTTATTFTPTDDLRVGYLQETSDQQRVMMQQFTLRRMKRMLHNLTSGDLAHIHASHVSRSSNPYRVSTTYIDDMIKKLEHNQNIAKTLD